MARRDELVQSYRSTIINAFADVDTSLETIQSTTERQNHQLEQIKQTEIALRLAERRYKEGAENLLTVLTAQRSLYDTQDELQQIRFSHLQAIVSLYRALGGGWAAESYAQQ